MGSPERQNPPANGVEPNAEAGAIDAKSELQRGLLWFGSATLVMRVLDVAGLFLLLRKLDREEMGVASLAWSVAIVFEAFSGLGVGSALVQTKEVSRRELDSLYWFTTFVGVLLAGAMAASAPLVASFYREPRLAWMLVAASSKLLFVGISVVPLQLLARDLRFKEASAVQTGASALEAATKIVLLLANTGAWAPVTSNAARGLYALAFVYLLAPYRPGAHYRFADVRRFLDFGARNMISNVIFFIQKNTDYFFVGRFLGIEALGVYRVAFDVAMTPFDVVVQVVNRVAFPVYSRIAQNPEALEAAFARSCRYLFLLLGPSMVFLAFAASDTVTVIAHERWLAAVPAAKILCIAALLRGFAELYPQVFFAVGRAEYAVYAAVLSTLTLAGGFWAGLTFFGARYGALTVAAVWVLAYPVVLAVEALWTRRIAALRVRSVLSALLPVTGALAAMALPLALLAYLHPEIGALGRFLLSAASGLFVYGLYLYFVLGMTFRDLGARPVATDAGP